MYAALSSSSASKYAKDLNDCKALNGCSEERLAFDSSLKGLVGGQFFMLLWAKPKS
eukprot:CAMPEP_0172844308 /NCGR_PEP_ID=MMETSP1075-20121228/32113_1 /TAXON_ID=2916 /ORGANISM="Ceratium fusus, Strain PA161109" /LENGTH=55 /DNA_ID=CAMNT_0013688715 /DNA_START=82 /DNA_END=245 /DNA_ORIENTATION=-